MLEFQNNDNDHGKLATRVRISFLCKWTRQWLFDLSSYHPCDLTGVVLLLTSMMLYTKSLFAIVTQY